MIHFSLVQPAKRRVKVSVTYKLDANIFERYKTICDSMNVRYDAEIKDRSCTIDTVPEIMEALVAAKFKCTLEEELLNVIQHMAERIQKDNFSAGKRLRAMEKALAKKGMNLFPYQRTGIQWLAPRRRAILSDEMGLGKTIQAVMALPENTGTVVICPGVAKGVWYNETRKWRPDIMPYIFEGRGTFCWPKPGEMYIFNFAILPGEPPDNIPKGINIIVDEAHNVKNVRAKQTQFTRAIGAEAIKHHGKGIMLTGSPMLNRPSELWTVLETFDLGVEAYGNQKNFIRLFNGTPSGNGFSWGLPDPEAPILLKKVMLVRKKVDVLKDLPTKMYNDINVNLSDKKVQKQLDKLLKNLKDSGLDLENVTLEELQKEQLIFEKISKIRAQLATAKIPNMLEFVENFEENEEPLVVFSAHRAPIEALAHRPGWAIITGKTSYAERDQITADFQAGKYKGLGLTIKSGGVAITLTHAAHALFVDLMWTPALNEQAEDRICRIGQDRGCQIYRFVCKHVVEERVHHLLTQKKIIIVAGVDAAKTTENDVTEYNMRLDILDKVTIGGALTPTEPINRFKQTLAKSGNIIVDENIKAKPSTRDANNPVEMWAKTGLLTLSNFDPDMAREKNDIGFNKFDGVIGHDFAKRLKNGGLTEKQWKVAVNMCKKYQKQISSPPDM